MRLAFAWSPWSVTAGEALNVDVLVLDEQGGITSDPTTVTLAVTAGTLGGTTSRAAVDGVARFTGLTLTRAGDTKLAASAPGLQGVETGPLTVAPGVAASLAFDAEPPATTTAGATLPPVKVAVRDAYGNLATGAGFQVVLSTQGATLFGGSVVYPASGVATFPTLSVRTPGRYILTASGGGLPPVQSTAFDVAPAAASRLVFGVQPSSATAGDILDPPVQVRVEDVFGNLVPETRDVTIAAQGLSGTATVTAVAGTATFTDLSVTRAGTSALAASADGLTGATSATFSVSPGPPASLVFSVEPPLSVAAGAAMTTVAVRAEDAFGNVCTDRSDDLVDLSLEGAELLGTASRGLVAGVASFYGLSVTKAASGYHLSASGLDLGPVTSRAFDVTPGAVHHLTFATQPPAATIAGATLSPSILVATQDAHGNVTPATGSVVVSMFDSGAGVTLLGTRTRSLVAGIATFADLSITKASAGNRLHATGPVAGVTAATSDAFDVVPAAATKLAFVAPARSIRSGQAMSPPPAVAITDEWLNVVATTARDVTLALEPNATGAVLLGTTTVTTAAGVATFDGLTVGETGTGYRLRAMAPDLADATSGAFDVSPNWISVGPDGGQVTALAGDPAVSDLAYAATAGCVWKWGVGATKWARACTGLSLPMQIDGLVVHPSSSDTVFAATSEGLYRSDDAAGTWSRVASLGGASPYRTLAVAVAASGAIYAGTFADGLWRSDDGGATWERLANGLPPKRITAIAIEPASTEVLYAAAVDANYVGTVYRSDDRGDAWVETALGPAAFAGVKPTSVLVDPSAAASVYVGTQTGVYESADFGATFAEGYFGADVRALAAHGPSRTRFAAGTAAILRKQDAGQWLPVSAGFPSDPKALAVAVRANGTALAGTRYGVYDRTTSATSWTLRTTGLRALNVTAIGAGRLGATVLYAATWGGGVFRSLDGGTSWVRGNHPAEGQMFYGIAVERNNALRAWLAGATKLYRTVDGGVTWTESALPNSAMSTIIDPSNDSVVYAGGTSDVFRSANGGGSFRDLNVCLGDGPMRQMALSSTAPLALWVGGDAGLCKVDLAGVNLIDVPYESQPGTSGLVDAIAVDPDPLLAGSTVWASTSHGFHKTVDGGATWTKTTEFSFEALLAQPGKLFGARSFGAVEVSRDGGATFTPAGVGLYHGHVRALVDVPGLPNEIYAGTGWGSVFKTTSGGE